MKKHNDAVSEVVGVMLMLSITIVLATVLAASVGGLAGVTEKPVTATISAVEIKNANVTFENVAGDSVSLQDISLGLGVRENASMSAVVPGRNLVPAVTGSSVIALGDRFVLNLNLTSDKQNLTYGSSFRVKAGEHLTYRFYDTRSASPFSSGEIRVVISS